MVRGNWQKRVEMADARRKEGKQKKLRDQDKRVYKKWMQDFLVQMDNEYSLLDWSAHANQKEEEDEDGGEIRKGQQKIMLTSSTTLHVWSETTPVAIAAPTRTDDDDSNPRPATLLDTPTKTAARTPSSVRGKSKKKLHPRSKELEQNKNHHSEMSLASSANTGGNNSGDKMLYKRHFFYGKSRTSSVGSRHDHQDMDVDDDDALEYKLLHTSMASVLKRASEKSQQQLEDAYNAVTQQQQALETSDESMDMVYYIPIDFKKASAKSSSSLPIPVSSVSDLITAALVERSIPLASVVYVVLHDTLIYDRYRNGSIGIHEKQQLDAAANNTHDHVNDYDTTAATVVHHLPNAILEHILTYLPDPTAVTILSRVCKAWHREISSNAASPNLWIHLLQRQSWPVVQKNGDNDANAHNSDHNAVIKTAESAATVSAFTSTIYREQFIKHYLAMRNVRALALGVSALLGATTTTRYINAPASGRQHGNSHHHHQAVSIPETEMTFFDFTKRRKFAPKNVNDTCVALLEWSPQHILAAYAQDCTLRLFQAVRSSNDPATATMMASGRVEQEPKNGLPEKRCKELICCSVDPYRSTKKRTCTLESVAIDAEYIGCLCSVSAENVLPSDTHAAIIVVTSRDDFLLGESSSTAVVQGGAGAVANTSILEDSKVIDIGEAVLDYLLSSSTDEADHRYMPLLSFLSNGGEIGDVSIKTSWHLVACGHGRFLVEVSIAIPLEDDNFDEDAIHQVDRKIVLFSANAGSMVLWMGDSYPIHTGSLPPVHNSSMVIASGCSSWSRTPPPRSDGTGQVLSPSRPLRTVAVRSEIEPSILVYEMDCFNIRIKHQQQEEQTTPRFVEESCLARNEVLAQLAAATTTSGEDDDGAPLIEWRVHPSHHLLVTSTDIVTVDLLQRHIVQVEQQNVNDIDPTRVTEIRDRKTVLYFYPNCSQRASSSSAVEPESKHPSYDVLVLKGMLQAEAVLNDERNDHVIVLCTELQKKETRSRRQPPRVQRDVSLEDIAHGSDEEGEDVGELDGEWFGGANQDVSYCWEESLVLVAVHVPSRREIGRRTLPETKVILTMNQADDYDSITSPSSWRPRLSSISAGGTLGLALNVVGIILTGDDVRSLGATDQVLFLGAGPGGNVEHRPLPDKKKKKKGKRSGGGKKDGFARGQSPW